MHVAQLNVNHRSLLHLSALTHLSRQQFGKKEDTDYMLRFLDVYEITNDVNDDWVVESKNIEDWNTRTNSGVSFKKIINEIKIHCKKNGYTNIRNERTTIEKIKTTYWFGIRVKKNVADEIIVET